MDYREKVMAYANVIQIFSSEEDELNAVLDTKIHSYAHEPEPRAFWTEVRGRIHRVALYNEISELIQIERKHLGKVEQFPDVGAVARSGTLLKWLSFLPKFEQEVEFLLDYQRDNLITEKNTEANKFKLSIGSLQFLNDAITAGKSLNELFKYIPLVTWSVESLLVTKNLHEGFESFLLENFVPISRAHRAAVLIFLDLVENEEVYLSEEKKVKATLAPSTIFSRDYKPEVLNLSIPVDPRESNPEAEDPYLDHFSISLRAMFGQGKLIGPRVEQATRDWFFSPLSHLYRLRLHSDLLGCTEEYTPVMSPKLLDSASSKLYTHRKLYGERNLLESSILGIENLIMESQDTEYKGLYVPRFNEALDMLIERLDDLLKAGLVTAPGVADTLKRVKMRGEAYGIYLRGN